jgi:glutamate-ammonia-ligase adenylyltransferase
VIVTKPETQRPRLPSVGRLGLVDPLASDRLTDLGWCDRDDRAHVDRLWALSRAPDADAALRALVRLSEQPEADWEKLSAALLTERPLRGRLFAVLGSSLALGDHLVANPQSWELLRGTVTLPSRAELLATFTGCADDVEAAPGSAALRLQKLYRDHLLVLAALDLAPTVEDEPVLPFTTVGAHLSDIADAALADGCERLLHGQTLVERGEILPREPQHRFVQMLDWRIDFQITPNRRFPASRSKCSSFARLGRSRP